MIIWVDADACPGGIKDIILRAAIKRVVDTVFVANALIQLPTAPGISFVRVGQGSDIADQYIAERAQRGDLVITQDIPLAALLVPEGIVVISPYGTLFTKDNIGERLSVRNFLSDLRGTGVSTGGPKPFGNQEKQQFSNAFDQALTKLLRA